MNAIITGATKGIGRAIVMELAANNYNIIFCARDEKEVQTLLNELTSRYSHLQFFGMRAVIDEVAECLQRQMQVNVFAPHYLSKFFASRMIEAGKGHIINICSIASLEPVVRAGSYSISKTALLGLNKALREELRPAGIKVTAVLPGSTLTNSWTGTELPEDWFILPEDVAKSIINCLAMSSGANIDEIVIRPLYGKI
jgi:short-subunit dehydrogenase